MYRNRRVDTSLIKLLELPGGGLSHFVPPGRSRLVRPGHVGLAVGSAYDEGSRAPPSLTAGLVSAVEPGKDGDIYTSAGFNEGINGGPFVDLRGQLIGTLSTYVDPLRPNLPGLGPTPEEGSPFGYLGRVIPIDRVLEALRNVPEAAPLLSSAARATRPSSAGADLEAVYRAAGGRIHPSLVGIDVQRKRPITTETIVDGRRRRYGRYQGSFSGVVAGQDLVVTSLYNLTNVAERLGRFAREGISPASRLQAGLAEIEAIEVHVRDGRRLNAELIAHDLRYGFGLLRVENDGQPLPGPTIAPASSLERGRFVLAAGNPFGNTRHGDHPLLTQGVLTKYHTQREPEPWRGMWQTDAGVIDGNVGGAAVDLHGRILGLLTTWNPAHHGRNSGVGFIVPWSKIQDSIPNLLAGRSPALGMVGVSFSGTAAPIITHVAPGGAAARAGLRIGDIVRMIDGQPVPNSREAIELAYQRVEGERLLLTILRGGQVRTYELELGPFITSE